MRLKRVQAGLVVISGAIVLLAGCGQGGFLAAAESSTTTSTRNSTTLPTASTRETTTTREPTSSSSTTSLSTTSSRPTTSRSTTTRATSTTVRKTSTTTATGTELKTPEQLGSYNKVVFPGIDDIAGPIRAVGESSVVAAYGEGSIPAYVLIALALGQNLPARPFIDGVLGGLGVTDKSAIEERQVDGITFGCVAGQGSFASVCTWIDGRIAGIGMGAPGSPIGSIDANLALASEAAKKIK